MKLGIIAGNRLFPVILAQELKKHANHQIVAVCFRGETSKSILKFVDRAYWIEVGQLSALRSLLVKEGVSQCILAGQITPMRIFKKKGWDNELKSLVGTNYDFRPHVIFSKIIAYLENVGIKFIDSITFLKEYLSSEGAINGINIPESNAYDKNFGVKIASQYVPLDIGQTVVVKKGSVVALESLEGTDRTIRRAFKLAGGGCTVIKFSKPNQDLRFDVPVVGISTLKLMRRVRAASLILENQKVLILEKEKFLRLSRSWNIPVWGENKSLV